jgi:hypothetical protein
MARPRRQPPITIESVLRQYMGGLLTPAQQRKQARQQTNLAVQDSMRQLRTTMQREREGLLREQYAQGAWAGLLRGYGAEGSAEAQAIKDAYSRAAGLTEAEATGFINPTIAQQAQNVTAGQGAAQAVAGYTGDVGTAGPGANAAVLGYLASLPRGTFAAKAEAEAKGLGSAAAQAGAPFAMRQAELGQDLRELRDEYTMAVQNLQAKRPGMLQEALLGLSGERRSDIATILNALAMQMNLQQTRAELTGTFEGKPTQAAKEAWLGFQLEQAEAEAERLDEAGRLAVQQMNARTSRMQAQIAQGRLQLSRDAQRWEQSGGAKDRVKLESDFRKNAQKWVSNMLNINAKTGLPRGTPPPKQVLINGIIRLYGRPLIGRFGLTGPLLNQWAQQVVSAFPRRYWQQQQRPTPAGGGAKGVTPQDILAGG